MLDPIEIMTMRARKNAAKNSLRFFKNIEPVKSPNWISCFIGSERSCFIGSAIQEQEIIINYRNEGNISVMDAFSNAIRTGFGNCGEKASICYAGLAGNPALINNSVVTLCIVKDKDHSIVLVSDALLDIQSNVRIRDLGKTAMVVDGWTKDWYFPNLDKRRTFLNHLENIPNPRQFSIRYGVMHSIIYADPCNNFRSYPQP